MKNSSPVYCHHVAKPSHSPSQHPLSMHPSTHNSPPTPQSHLLRYKVSHKKLGLVGTRLLIVLIFLVAFDTLTIFLETLFHETLAIFPDSLNPFYLPLSLPLLSCSFSVSFITIVQNSKC